MSVFVFEVWYKFDRGVSVDAYIGVEARGPRGNTVTVEER